MLARSIRRHAARLVRHFSKIELKEARAEVEKLQAEFFRINSAIKNLNQELATNTSTSCVSTLIPKNRHEFRGIVSRLRIARSCD